MVQGKPCRRKYLVVSFPYSNDGFAQVFGGETAECVCQGLKNIFKYIGGVPRLLVFDNATGVGRRIGDRIHETELFRTAGEKYPETNFYTILPYHYGGNIRTYFVRISASSATTACRTTYRSSMRSRSACDARIRMPACSPPSSQV